MKALKIVVIVLVVYGAVVATFESLLGYYQPAGQTTLVITTTDADGNSADRVLSKLELDGAVYVAANHWPRAWYRHVLRHPEVQVTIDGVPGNYTAVSASPAEDDRLEAAFGHGLGFRLLTGFPPRYFVRLDPQPALGLN